jgi:L-2-hydroxyglutarate oxidase LhgO
MSRPSRTKYDLVVVGGGIVGLATAREFLRRYPNLQLLVLEKELQIATHQSGHNSGVIHTGIYYAPGSIKAQACVAGHQAMLDYAREKGIPFEVCGKVIVALNKRELPRLDDLYKRGVDNGVQGLEMIGPERLREIEPHAAGIKAIYSPNTGIIDYSKVAHAYADDIQQAGGEIVTAIRVDAIAPRNGTNDTGDKTAVLTIRQMPHADWEGQIEARAVITCAGLHSDLLAQMTGAPKNVRIVPFRGDYYVLKPEKRNLVRNLIYPVPDPSFPFLGVHFTRTVNGEVLVGPNAVLAFAREGYGRKDISPKELLEVLTYPGFWRLALRYGLTGLAEMYRDFVKSAYTKTVQRYVPDITADDLLPGPSGVRAQALASNGKLLDDFLITGGGSVAHIQNAPSPGATSSLIIARLIADKTEQSLDLKQN